MSSSHNSLSNNTSSLPSLSTIMEAEQAVAQAIEEARDLINESNAVVEQALALNAAVEAANQVDDPFTDRASTRSGTSTIRPIRGQGHADDASIFSFNADRDIVPAAPVPPAPPAPVNAPGPMGQPMGYAPPHHYAPPGYYPPHFPPPFYPYPAFGPWGPPSPYWGPAPVAQPPPPPPPPASMEPTLSAKAQGKATVKVRVTADNDYVAPLNEESLKKTFSPPSWFPTALVPKGRKPSSKASGSGSGATSPGPSSSQTVSQTPSSAARVPRVVSDLLDVDLWVGRLQSLGIDGTTEQLTHIAQNIVQYLFESVKEFINF